MALRHLYSQRRCDCKDLTVLNSRVDYQAMYPGRNSWAPADLKACQSRPLLHPSLPAALDASCALYRSTHCGARAKSNVDGIHAETARVREQVVIMSRLVFVYPL